MQAGKVFHANYGNQDFQETASLGRTYTPPEKLVKEPVQMGNVRLVDWGVTPPGTDTLHNDYKVASWGVQKLDSIRAAGNQQPFFMALGFVAPHVPYYAEQKWFDMYPPADQIALPPAPEGDRADVPPFAWYLNWYLPEPRLSWLLENHEWEAKVRAYLASISFMDAQVGRVMDALERDGLAENTIVVLFSDHGYHLGEKDLTGKNTLWERSTHVPLVYAGPGITSGARSSRPTDLMDLFPTLVQLAGLPAKAGLEGLSVVPQLRDAAAPRERPAITSSNPGNTSVRSERWHYIRYAEGSEELYDHYRDPSEFTNLAGKPEYARVKADLARWIPANQAPHVPGSASRVLWKEGDTWYWEGKPILPSELID
jgi:arylsulfatase A-like enzyme